MNPETETVSGDQPPAPWGMNRRVLVKAAATFAALSAAWGVPRVEPGRATAQTAGKTRAQRWSEAAHAGDVQAAGADGGRVAEADFRFYAVGASWHGELGAGFAVELRFDTDNFGEPVTTHAATEDGYRPNRGGRIFTHLVFVDGAMAVRYRTLDAAGNPVELAGFELAFIDATDGPSGGGSVTEAGGPTLQKPPVVSRAGWGADESLRFDAYGEIWPREYQLVEKVIVHHTVTTNNANTYATVRSIYYYHAVEQGWGDIGYNYLVGHDGNIFEGRAGGDNVVGGHSFQYGFGSSGISCLGTFNSVDVSASAWSSLIAIVAWVGRNLDPLGNSPFKEHPNLPNICGHRDTNVTECPGDMLWADMPALRNAVDDVLESSTIPPDGGVPPQTGEYKTGDNVITTKATSLRSGPSTTGTWVVRSLPLGLYAAINGGARFVDGQEWYYVHTQHEDEGYVLGKYLDPAPPGNPPSPRFEVGDRVKVIIADLNLRRRPGIGQLIPMTLALGTPLTVSVASVAATGYRWFGVHRSDNASGWVVQEGIGLVERRRLTLSRTSGHVGQDVIATFSGLPMNKLHQLQWDGVTIKSFTTDSLGRAAVPFKVPHSPTGSRLARGIRGVARAYARFEVKPRVATAPKSAGVGQTIQVVCTGYLAGEAIDVQMQQSGSTYQSLAKTAADGRGTARVYVAVPAWATGRPIIKGVGTTNLATTTFTVTPPTAAEVPTATPTRTPAPGPSATPPPASTPTAPPEPTAAPTETPSPTPEPTQAPTETPTPEPTSTPQPEETPAA